MLNFLKHWKLIEIKHRYFYSESEYGILTLMNELQACAACYYLQYLKAELPHFDNLYLDEDLLPEDIVFLLSKLYEDCFAVTGNIVYPLRSNLKFTATIDLYEIWEFSPYSVDMKLVDHCAKKGAKQAIINLMYKNASGDIRSRNEKYEGDLNVLRQIKEGINVEKEWNLRNSSGEVYLGKIEFDR